MLLREFSYYLSYGFDCFVLGKRKPIVAGIGLTDVCNLQCRHCVVANSGRGHYSYEKILEWISLFYKKGARILYFQGGEPFGWSDGVKKTNDLVRAAKAAGFYKVAIASNGTYPVETEADVVWISLDGTAQQHDGIRGEGVYERIMKNIGSSSHPNICVNTTINTINYKDIEKVIKIIGENPRIRGISVNFHTPYPGVEDLLLSAEMKMEVVERVINMKKKGYPVLNSVSGLKALAAGNYKRPLWMIQMVERDKVNECCWGSDYGEKVCKNCGYGVIAELSQLLKLKPDSIIHAFKLF